MFLIHLLDEIHVTIFIAKVILFIDSELDTQIDIWSQFK